MKLFGLRLFFDEPTENEKAPPWDSVHDFEGIEFNDDGSMKIPSAQNKLTEKEEEKPKDDESNEDEEDEEVEEDDDEDEEDEDEEDDDESNEDEEDEEVEEDEAVEGEAKRLKDTQRAYHEGQKRIKELEERLSKLEKPPEQDDKGEKKNKEEKEELTLENIDPNLLQESMKKDPVMTMRWIADQQTKASWKEQQKVTQREQEVAAKESRIEASEQAAVKQFPVLDKILKMDDAAIEKFKTKSPEQYKFAAKTLEYQKAFQAKGDEEALLNGAARAYAEMSPSVMKKLKKDVTKAVSKARTDKKKAVKGAAVSSGSRTKPKSKNKKVSESEFFSMNQQEQTDAMYADFENRLQRLNKKN